MDRLQEWKNEIGEIPENSCGKIDACIKAVNEAYKFFDSIEKLAERKEADELKDIEDLASDGYYSLHHTEDHLEEIRTCNEKLRELGKFWYEKCKELLADWDKK